MTDLAVPRLPAPVPPMLASSGEVPGGSQWRYEYKWDGVRAITAVAGASVQARSRNDRDITRTYPELDALPTLVEGRVVVLDGELVALDAGGRPEFARLQDRMHVERPSAALLAAVSVRYYVFDLLYLDGESTVHLPYERRRSLLEGLGLPGLVQKGANEAGTYAVHVPRYFENRDRTIAAAHAFGLEGVMAKRLGSTYQPGRRSPDWVKHPFVNTTEVVIIGYRPGQGRRAGTIGSLLIATFDTGATLRFAGGVGTGFRQIDLYHLEQMLAPLHRMTPPIPDVPRQYGRDATWVEPVVIGDVAYRNRTPDGLLRHPSWRGVRPDRELPTSARPGEPGQPHLAGSMATPDGAWRIEIWRRDGTEWCRIIHGNTVIDGLDMAAAQHTLAAVGVDLADLIAAA
ncbi:non-homologous end-joining DNA ligase [Dactylosporangium sucinum]|uniref:DNA ligase (ATP) n=1 Tax=Dactylosporangium sucinum TaxID=1424081 RepID=A0A917U2Z6_9ACTN|nr:non-homologous end-joining DNA ligase [Dactylosporangium sucinum]GGM51621.1 hypothetical protein GCM10007977_061710 [Dactylosporangium sucinum]